MGCRHDYVGITAGVPQLADDLLRRPSRQQRAITGHYRIAVLSSSSSPRRCVRV